MYKVYIFYSASYSDKWSVVNLQSKTYETSDIYNFCTDNISTVNAVIAQNVSEQTMNEASHK